MNSTFEQFAATTDNTVITLARKARVGLTRGSLFLIFFWFGALKVIDASPAQPLVTDLLKHTLPFIEPHTFMVAFGVFEMLIGILFLFHNLERFVVTALAVHMFTTFMPLILLPEVTWSRPFVPTLEGQYILKNVVIIALAARMVARLHPKNMPQVPVTSTTRKTNGMRVSKRSSKKRT